MIAVHADWSVDARKRWMAVGSPEAQGWSVSIVPVGDLATLLDRLRIKAQGGPVALGVDFPIGLPRAYAGLHAAAAANFPQFLRGLARRPGFFAVADRLDQVGPDRPFYPRRGVRGMTRLSHALALGLPDAAGLSRLCDRATGQRPAGAPLFWTLGANQSGKAALSAWRELLLPALDGPSPPSLWPFEGSFRALLRPGCTTIAETYPADAMRQLGISPVGSKRRQADRAQLVPGLRAAMAGLGCSADLGTKALLDDGFGPDAAGEDRLDCLLGVLCVMLVLAGRRPDTAPPDPWVTTWEGWVLGQAPSP